MHHIFESLEQRRLLSASVVDHILTITGSNKSDQIIVNQTATAYTLSFNGKQSTITDLPLLGIKVDAKAGNDHVLLNVNIPTSINGGAGNDILTGGVQADHLQGGPGNDILTGNDGDDVLQGDQGNDILFGGNGADYLSGGQGDDLLDSGAGIDQSKGGPGNDDTLQPNDKVSDQDKADKGKNHTPRLKIQPINSVRTSTGTIQLTNPSVWVTQPGTGGLIGGSGSVITVSSGNFDVSGGSITLDLTNHSSLPAGIVKSFPPLCVCGFNGILSSNLNLSSSSLVNSGAGTFFPVAGTLNYDSPDGSRVLTILAPLSTNEPSFAAGEDFFTTPLILRVKNNADIQPGSYPLITYNGQQLTDLSNLTLDASALPSTYTYSLIPHPDTASFNLLVTLPPAPELTPDDSTPVDPTPIDATPIDSAPPDPSSPT